MCDVERSTLVLLPDLLWEHFMESGHLQQSLVTVASCLGYQSHRRNKKSEALACSTLVKVLPICLNFIKKKIVLFIMCLFSLLSVLASPLCVCMCTHMCMHACLCACTYVYTWTSVNMFSCMCGYVYMCERTTLRAVPQDVPFTLSLEMGFLVN